MESTTETTSSSRALTPSATIREGMGAEPKTTMPSSPGKICDSNPGIGFSTSSPALRPTSATDESAAAVDVTARQNMSPATRAGGMATVTVGDA